MENLNNIKKQRKKIGMTQEELADHLGLQKSAIAKYENGRVKNIKRSTIQKMAEVLKCSPSYLMGWTDDEKKDDTSGNVPKSGQDGYYTNPETAKIAQEIFETPGYRILFDAARDSKPEDLQMAADLLRRLKGENSNDPC